jgi:hypothetical protein
MDEKNMCVLILFDDFELVLLICVVVVVVVMLTMMAV